MSIEEHDNSVDTDALRADLKAWENAFRKANGGQKPGRADIKSDATIAAKYQLYDRLCRASRKQPPPASTPKKSTRHSETKEALREKPKNTVASTPRSTPSKSKQTSLQPPVLSPIKEAEATPAFIRRGLGPTPQKDGQVLGVFDLASGGTPSKDVAPAAPDMDTVIAGTPSKPTTNSLDALHSQTPQSSGKRYFLDAFAGTPLKRKREDDLGSTSSSKRNFATPSFLRRSFPLASIDEESADVAPAPAPFKKRSLVRSLSSIIQGLKKHEEKQMDDEWDILNEMEEEEQVGNERPASKVLVEDSQAPEMPLGPDQAPESDEDSAPEVQGQTRKPWKKKGLKRQTRRTNMRPVFHKAKKDGDLEEQNEGSETDVVAETQLQGAGDDTEAAGVSESDEDNAGKPKMAALSKALKKKKPTAPESKDGDAAKLKPKRKVNELAHANFRALKIKNKNSKGKGGGRRFGRR